MLTRIFAITLIRERLREIRQACRRGGGNVKIEVEISVM